MRWIWKVKGTAKMCSMQITLPGFWTTSSIYWISRLLEPVSPSLCMCVCLCVSHHLCIKTSFQLNTFGEGLMSQTALGSRETVKNILNSSIDLDALSKTWIVRQFRCFSTCIKFKGREQVTTECTIALSSPGQHPHTHVHSCIFLFDVFCSPWFK